jgi:hypothetical protein
VVAESGIEVSASGETTVEMSSDPAVGTASPVTDITDLKSFFQYNLAGVLAQRWISWARGATDCVVYMTTSYLVQI